MQQSVRGTFHVRTAAAMAIKLHRNIAEGFLNPCPYPFRVPLFDLSTSKKPAVQTGLQQCQNILSMRFSELAWHLVSSFPWNKSPAENQILTPFSGNRRTPSASVAFRHFPAWGGPGIRLVGAAIVIIPIVSCHRFLSLCWGLSGHFQQLIQYHDRKNQNTKYRHFFHSPVLCNGFPDFRSQIDGLVFQNLPVFLFLIIIIHDETSYKSDLLLTLGNFSPSHTKHYLHSCQNAVRVFQRCKEKG